MKLEFLEIAGFRGVRNIVRFDFPASFTVICGRNGVGKSTIFDAIEFAITDSIDEYRIEKSGREDIFDYIWWRGVGRAAKHNVALGFVGDDGNRFSFARSRETGATASDREIEERLCLWQSKPEHALEQLCRTTIIRDEWIAALSLDLTETARFELVRAALGAVEDPSYSKRASEILTVVDNGLKEVRNRERETEAQLSSALVEMAEVQSEAQRSGDVASALAVLEREVPDVGGEIAERIAAVREALVRKRRLIEDLTAAMAWAHELAQELRAVTSDAYANAISEAEKEAERAAQRTRYVADQLREAEGRLELERQADALAASLASLIEHGAHLGLQDGQNCPLCGAVRTPAEFEVGVSMARERLEHLNVGVDDAQRQMLTIREELEGCATAAEQAKNRLFELHAHRTRLNEEEGRWVADVRRAGIDVRSALHTEALDAARARMRRSLVEIERALVVLEASRSVERLTDIQQEIQTIRARSDHVTIDVSRHRTAMAAAC